MLPFENDICKSINEKHSILFSYSENIWNIAVSLITEQDIVGIDSTRAINAAIAGIYAKQLRLFKGISLLCEYGLSYESQILLRVMFELHLNLKYIEKEKDKSNVCRLFIIWDSANYFKIDRIFSESGFLESKITEELKMQMDSIKDELIKEGINWKLFIKHGPSLKNVENLAKDFGLTAYYNAIYRFSSSIIHSYDINSYAISDNKTIHINLSPNDRSLRDCMISSIFILSYSLLVIDELLKINKNNSIVDIQNIIKEMKATLKLQ